MLLNLKALPCLFQAVHFTGVPVVCVISVHVDSHTVVSEEGMSGEGKKERQIIHHLCTYEHCKSVPISSEKYQSLWKISVTLKESGHHKHYLGSTWTNKEHYSGQAQLRDHKQQQSMFHIAFFSSKRMIPCSWPIASLTFLMMRGKSSYEGGLLAWCGN